MKKLFLLLILLFPIAASAKITVVGTLPVFSSLAKEIGGDRIETSSLARPNQDPHFLDAKPAFVVALNRADVLVHGGLTLESGWLKPVLLQAQNAKINPGAAGSVDLSKGLMLLEAGQSDRSLGDVHPQGNPHTWLNPDNARVMAATIAGALSAVDPEGKTEYEANLASFQKQLNARIASWKAQLAPLQNARIITYHKSLSYLANWAGFEVPLTIEPKPGIPPSSKHVDELLMKIPELKIKGILMESFYPRKVPEFIAGKAGIPLVAIPVNVGEAGTKDYLSLMDVLIGKIKGTL